MSENVNILKQNLTIYNSKTLVEEAQDKIFLTEFFLKTPNDASPNATSKMIETPLIVALFSTANARQSERMLLFKQCSTR